MRKLLNKEGNKISHGIMSNVGKILWRDDAGERQTAKPQEKRSVEEKSTKINKKK